MFSQNAIGQQCDNHVNIQASCKGRKVKIKNQIKKSAN